MLYRIKAYKGYNGSADDPVGELEVWIPLIHSALEPTEGLPATKKKGKEGKITYIWLHMYIHDSVLLPSGSIRNLVLCDKNLLCDITNFKFRQYQSR